MIIDMRTFSILCTLLLAFTALPAAAQLTSNQFTTPEYGLEIQPEFPRPGETITATLTDHRGSSFGATVTWLVDGKVISTAENQRKTTLTAGKIGVPQTIEVILSKSGNTSESLKKIITPLYVDIVIEPQTRTPDFYIGRSLPSIGSIVNATALINGSKVPASDLVYTWRIGQQVIEGGPIRGRNQVSYTTPMGDRETLTVQIATTNGTIIARRSVSIPSVSPTIQFYELSPLFGLNSKTIIDSIPLIGNSTVIKAEPYYLDSRVYNQPAISQWKIGGITTSNQSSNPYEITLQRSWSGGSTELEFQVRDTTQVLQGAKGSTRINF